MVRPRASTTASSSIREDEAQPSDKASRPSRLAQLAPDNPETETSFEALSREAFPSACRPKTVWIGCYDIEAQRWRFAFPTDASLEKTIAHFETTFQEAEQLEKGFLFAICSFFVDVKDERLKTFPKETRKAVEELSLSGAQPILRNEEAYQLVLYLTDEWPEEEATPVVPHKSASGAEQTHLPHEGHLQLTEAEAVDQLESLLAEAHDPFAYFSQKLDRILAAAASQSTRIRTKSKAVRARLKKITSLTNEIAFPPITSDAAPDALALADQVNACLIDGREPLRKVFQAYLDRLFHIGTKGFGSFEMNDSVARKVNQLAADHGMRLILNDEPVTVRCVQPRGSIAGSFETRTATKDRRTIQTSTSWPRLIVSLRK